MYENINFYDGYSPFTDPGSIVRMEADNEGEKKSCSGEARK